MRVSQALKLLLNGIKSPIPLNPEMASKLFGLLIDQIGGVFTEYQCSGFVVLNDVDLMFVTWTAEGVYFQDHNITEDTIHVIHTALRTIELLTDDEDDEDTDSLLDEDSESESDAESSSDEWL